MKVLQYCCLRFLGIFPPLVFPPSHLLLKLTLCPYSVTVFRIYTFAYTHYKLTTSTFVLCIPPSLFEKLQACGFWLRCSILSHLPPEEWKDINAFHIFDSIFVQGRRMAFSFVHASVRVTLLFKSWYNNFKLDSSMTFGVDSHKFSENNFEFICQIF